MQKGVLGALNGRFGGVFDGLAEIVYVLGVGLQVDVLITCSAL